MEKENMKTIMKKIIFQSIVHPQIKWKLDIHFLSLSSWFHHAVCCRLFHMSLDQHTSMTRAKTTGKLVPEIKRKIANQKYSQSFYFFSFLILIHLLLIYETDQSEIQSKHHKKCHLVLCIFKLKQKYYLFYKLFLKSFLSSPAIFMQLK